MTSLANNNEKIEKEQLRSIELGSLTYKDTQFDHKNNEVNIKNIITQNRHPSLDLNGKAFSDRQIFNSSFDI